MNHLRDDKKKIFMKDIETLQSKSNDKQQQSASTCAT